MSPEKSVIFTRRSSYDILIQPNEVIYLKRKQHIPINCSL